MLPVQTSTPLNTNTWFKTFMADEMKCKPEVIKALNDYQGVNTIDSFEDFESDKWNSIVKQFLSPPMKAVSGNLEKQSPIIITVTCLKRLKASSCAIWYYFSCGYALTVQNMR